MGFGFQLKKSLRHRESQLADEFAAGESLKAILGRHLLAVEAAAETELLTSILLLDQDGDRLSHGAAPSLPASYCEAIDGGEIGPKAGSCGTAAFLNRAIYVTDIATDPLWKDYRDLALEHGLRACWSTPIREPEGGVIGTFAIYHPTPRSPTPDEVEAIRMITGQVTQAILLSRHSQDGPGLDNKPADQGGPTVALRLVSDKDDDESTGLDQPGAPVPDSRFEAFAAKLERFALMVDTPELAEALRAVAADCRKLVKNVRDARNVHGDGYRTVGNCLSLGLRPGSDREQL